MLAQVRLGVNKPEEAQIVARLEESIDAYLRREAEAASGSALGAAGREVAPHG